MKLVEYCSHSYSHFIGAASDKVAALERAGVIVSDSPAKLGALLLKVSLLHSRDTHSLTNL